jgi:hypothetical protein
VSELTLLSKPGCHLCHTMADLVERVCGLRPREVDITGDPALEARYALEIPVLLLGEKEIARHRVEENELRMRLAAAGFEI